MTHPGERVHYRSNIACRVRLRKLRFRVRLCAPARGGLSEARLSPFSLGRGRVTDLGEQLVEPPLDSARERLRFLWLQLSARHEVAGRVELSAGRISVSCSVRSLGVSGPNTPIELGMNTAHFCSRATSSTDCRLAMLTCQAKRGSRSPTAERIAARWYTVSASWRITAWPTAMASVASSN